MTIEIAEKYKASLVPFPKETLEPLNLPTETFNMMNVKRRLVMLWKR